MTSARERVSAFLTAAQQALLSAAKDMNAANKLAKALPEYKELEQLNVRLTNLARAIRKLDL